MHMNMLLCYEFRTSLNANEVVISHVHLSHVLSLERFKLRHHLSTKLILPQ